MFNFRAMVRVLREHEVEFAIVGGLKVRVLSLPRLIEVKKKLSRPKDQLALLQLQATLEERGGK